MARPDEKDTSRRDFFRTFGRETVRQAGAVAGAAAELRRSSMAAARVLFDEPTDLPMPQVDPTQPQATFRSAYRFTGAELLALDVRQLPNRLHMIAVTQPSEVASVIRSGAINGGPVLAEVGAYAMALAARAVVGRPETGRVQQMGAAANTLSVAKPQVRALRWAVDRQETLYLELARQGTDPIVAAERLQSEADSIASENAAAHTKIGRAGASAILAGSNDPLELLMLGDTGPLACGLVGMGTTLVQNLRDAGQQVHVWVAEGGPTAEGSRVSAFTFAQLDVPFTVIPDAALGWVFEGRHINALLLRGDEIAQNGDCRVLIGGLAAATVARAAKVPVLVLAPSNAMGDERYLHPDMPVAPGATRFNPSADVVSVDLITRVIGEAG